MSKTVASSLRGKRSLSPYWRGFFLALCAAIACGVVILVAFPEASGLYLLGLYSVPTNSMIPLPHEPGVLYFAKYYHPAWVALAGTLGTGVAAFADYDLIGRAMNHPRISKVKDAEAYQWAVRWLMARPFWTVVLFALTPLPVYVVRVLAPATGYPFGRYALAMMIGRYPRFLVLAYFGYVVPIPTWALILLFVAMIALVAIPALKRRARPEQTTSEPD